MGFIMLDKRWLSTSNVCFAMRKMSNVDVIKLNNRINVAFEPASCRKQLNWLNLVKIMSCKQQMKVSFDIHYKIHDTEKLNQEMLITVPTVVIIKQMVHEIVSGQCRYKDQ